MAITNPVVIKASNVLSTEQLLQNLYSTKITLIRLNILDFCIILHQYSEYENKYAFIESKKYLLQERDIPHSWYNIIPDMAQKPLPLIHPSTKQPLKPEDLYPIFSKAASEQELNTTDSWIEIPDEVREMYRLWRPTPLVRATGLEKLLDTPAHIYFKNESVSPVGSHKLNSAIAQAYYCKKEGVTNITTETGAGQWGGSIVACRQALWA